MKACENQEHCKVKVKLPTLFSLKSKKIVMATSSRLRVVNFMIYASTHLHFYIDSLHLAVRNLDQILSLKQYAAEDLELLGLGCLFDAAKHLENINHIPWSDEMAEYLKGKTKVTEDEIIK